MSGGRRSTNPTLTGRSTPDRVHDPGCDSNQHRTVKCHVSRTAPVLDAAVVVWWGDYVGVGVGQ
jgi:hypothetical protein